MKQRELDPLITQLCERFGMTRNHACQWKRVCLLEDRDLWSYGARKNAKNPRKRLDPETLLAYPGPTVLYKTQAGWRVAAATQVDEYIAEPVFVS